MASATEIANLAISKLGEARILDLTDATKPARAMNERFNQVRDAELMAHPWRFAVKRTTLAASTKVPAWGYSKIYERPVGDLRTLKIGDAFIDYRSLGVMFETSGYSVGNAPYEIIDGKIYTDLTAPLKYEYISQVTVTGLFDPMFVESFACRLAFDAAIELTQSRSIKDDIAKEYKMAVAEAKRVNSIMRSPPRRRQAGPWQQARVW